MLIPLRAGAEACARILQDFHDNFVKQLTDAGAEIEQAELLNVQLAVTKQSLDMNATSLINYIQLSSRRINRDFLPEVRDAMVPGYEACCAEQGQGMFERMKARMNAHVKRNRNS